MNEAKQKYRNWSLRKSPKPIDPEAQRTMDANLAHLRAQNPKPTIVYSFKELVYFMRLGYRFYTDGQAGYLQGEINGNVRIMMVDLSPSRGNGKGIVVNGVYGHEFLSQYRFSVNVYSDSGKEVVATNRYEFKRVGIEGRYTIWAVVQC